MKMLKFRKTFREDSAFAPWMFRIARNAGADHLRRASRDQHNEPEVDDLPGDLPATETQASNIERAALVRKALAKLPVQGREVLLLSRFEFKTYEEIGRVLGCSTGAVKIRAHRAMKQFRDAWLSLTEEPST